MRFGKLQTKSLTPTPLQNGNSGISTSHPLHSTPNVGYYGHHAPHYCLGEAPGEDLPQGTATYIMLR